MPGDHLIQRADDVGVPPQPGARRPIVRRPRQPHRLAGAPHRHAVDLHQYRQGFAFRGRRHRFRLRTSLIAAFSRASSAYIRLSFVFSASSSFSRFSSSTEAPAYFARHWKYVALLMLCCRRISAIGTPASPCFRMSTIWLSVNRDFRMGISLAPESLLSNGLPGGEAYGATSLLATYSRIGRISRTRTHRRSNATSPRSLPRTWRAVYGKGSLRISRRSSLCWGYILRTSPR